MGLLPYGYHELLPGEESSTVWMPNNASNWSRSATHSHDGVDSAPVSISSLTKATATLASGDWIVDGLRFKQSVTMPGAYTYSNTKMTFFISKGGDTYDGCEFYPTTIKTGDAQFTIYVPDNTIDVVVVYL